MGETIKFRVDVESNGVIYYLCSNNFKKRL